MAFNTKTPVSELWAEFINAEPIYYSWYDHNWGIDWNYAEADRCWGCGHIMVSDGGSIECDNCGRELEFEGPRAGGYSSTVDVSLAAGVYTMAVIDQREDGTAYCQTVTLTKKP